MSDVLYRDPELVLLTELCRELAKLGLNVGLGDARPAVMVHAVEPVWITLDLPGELFEWHEAQHRHPATDPVGAAALIYEQVTAQRSAKR